MKDKAQQIPLFKQNNIEQKHTTVCGNPCKRKLPSDV